MSEGNNRRDFLKKGATAVLGVGALGALSGGLAAGCVDGEGMGTNTAGLTAGSGSGSTIGSGSTTTTTTTNFVLNDSKYQQLVSFPEVRREFVMALDEVGAGLIADPNAYMSFLENTDSVGSLKTWDLNERMLTELVGPTDGTTKEGRLKRILTVSELYDGAALDGPGFLDSEYVSSSSSSSSSSSVSSGGSCATNGSPTNGCCVIHTWGWSKGEGLCGLLSAETTGSGSAL